MAYLNAVALRGLTHHLHDKVTLGLNTGRGKFAKLADLPQMSVLQHIGGVSRAAR